MKIEEQLINLRHSCELLLDDLMKISIEKNGVFPNYKISIYAESQNRYYYCNNFGVDRLVSAYVQKENDIISSPFIYVNHDVRIIIQNNKNFIENLFLQSLIQSYFNYISSIADGFEVKAGIKQLIPELDYSFIATNMANYIVKKLSIGYSFDLITNISALTYEGSKCVGSICFCEETPDLVLEFLENFVMERENIRQIRKLLELTKNEFTLIESELMIRGLSVKNVKCKCEIRFIGNMIWQLWKDNKLIFTYKNGIYIHQYCEDQDKLFKVELQREFVSLLQDRLEYIYKAILNCAHGALLLIMDNANEESTRLSTMNRGITVKINVCDSQLIEHIASIDGAILVDTEGTIYGIGMILDGRANVCGSVSRGARYNSALTYIYERAKVKTNCLAVVFSEDKTIDIISTSRLRSWEEL